MSDETKRLIGAVKTGQGVILQVRYLGLSLDLFLTDDQAATLETGIASARTESAPSLDDANMEMLN